LVKVAYDPRSGSRELARAADYEMEFDITALCRWIKLDKYEDRSKHFPQATLHGNCVEAPFNNLPGYRTGVIGPHKLPFALCDNNTLWHATVQINARDYSLYTFHDQAKLLEFLRKQCGEIEW